MATHYLAGTVAGVPGSYVDLAATLGYIAHEQEGDLDAALGISGQVEIPYVPGAILVGPERTEVRNFKLVGTLDGASQAAVRANLHLLKALATDGLVWVKVADWSTVQIQCKCIDFRVKPDPARHVSIPVTVEMTFRAPNPYWQDISPQAIAFNTSHTNMPQGTAEGWPVLTSPVGVLAACTLTGYDYLDTQIWSCTLEALLAGEQWRITVAPAVMTIEKFTGGVWVNWDRGMTAGRFPMVLPSNGVAFQSSLSPKLASSVGTWTSTYPKQWK